MFTYIVIKNSKSNFYIIHKSSFSDLRPSILLNIKPTHQFKSFKKAQQFIINTFNLNPTKSKNINITLIKNFKNL